jgi:anaerobic selenocysteine-containing dehydrogenase
VQWLVMLGVNPLYNAPVDLEFEAAFNKVPNSVHLGSHVDETGFYSTWHINKAHYLESWSDTRAYDGTISIVQPMIEPLYGGKSAHDVLQGLLDPAVSAYDAVLANAKTYLSGGGAAAPATSGAAAPSAATVGSPLELAWRKALHDGWVANTAFTPKTLGAPKGGATIPSAAASGIEISFKPDASVYDGRYANNGWLQELPRQVTSMSWDNAALMNMDLMGKLGIEENEAIELTLNGRKIITPVLMSPGHPNDAVTVQLGQGRRAEAGRVCAADGGCAAVGRRADDCARPWNV